MKVRPSSAGMRLDLFLKEHMPNCSRKQAKRLLDGGLVRVNGRKTVIASWELQSGDKIEVAEDSDTGVDVAKYFLKVVFEDNFLLIVEKDAGIACETSPLDLKPSLVQIVNAYLKKQNPGIVKPYLGLIHRLDKETSGLMVYSKKPVANRISKQFKDHTIQRRYHAVVHGQVDRENGAISTYLDKVDQPGGAKMMVVKRTPDAKKAETLFRVIERYSQASLLELIPKTGRTHQLRVHLAHLGHPIVGDKLYGNKNRVAGLNMKRQALHASVLGFVHPASGKKHKFESDLPKDLRQLVDRLRTG